VVVPAFTFVATAGAVMDCGARPVLADVDLDSALIDPAAMVRCLSSKTKAVVAVHLYGLPCDVPALRAALDAATPGRRVTILEDCAQAHGASRSGVRTGAMGDIAAFSFYPTKNLGAMGDGGGITTNDAELAAAVREISDHGRPADGTRRNEHLRVGLNSRLDAIQAAVLSIKLRHLPEWNAQRAAAAERYSKALGSRADVRLQDLPPGVVHSWYVHAFRHARRDALAAALARRGVQARAVYPSAIHEYPAYAFLGHRAGDFPAAEAWAREVLTLPMFALMRDDEIDATCAATLEALDEVGGGG
jgi:dTDP-4-amino-4,6-dideoxygalactose transaminase